jgi:hypothetical protein
MEKNAKEIEDHIEELYWGWVIRWFCWVIPREG